MELLAQITSAKRGTIHAVKYRTILRDKDGVRVEKVTSGHYRVGVNYVKVAQVIASGLGGGPLPGKGDKWLAFPYAIECAKGIKIRLTNTFNPRTKSEARYYVNGEEMTREEIEAKKLVCHSKLYPTHSIPFVTFTVFLDNIIEFR